MKRLRNNIMGVLLGASFVMALTGCVGGFIATPGPAPVPRPITGYIPAPYLRPRPIPVARPIRPMPPRFPAQLGPGPMSPGAMRPHAYVPQNPGPSNPIPPQRPAGF